MDDVGSVINPLLAKGQIQGVARTRRPGVARDIVYDRDSGHF